MVPLAALIVLQHLEERDSRKSAGISDAAVVAQSMASSMDRFATDVDSFTAAAAIRLGDQEAITQANTGAFLKSLSARYENLTALFLTDADGRVVAQSADGDNTGFDVSSRPYIQELKAGKDTVWSGGFQGLQSGEVLGTFGRTVRYPDGAIRGYLIAAFKPSNISASLPSDFPADANIYLIDQNARLVYSHLEPSRTEVGGTLENVSEVERALNGEAVRLDGAELLFEDDERYGAIAGIPRMGWAVGYTRSSDVLATSLLNGLLQDLAVLAVIMVVVLAALLFIARQMTRPLKRLAFAAREITEGRDVALTSVSTTDREVAELQRAFMTMSDAVREREARLTEQAERLRHLEEAGAAISAGLDFEATVQAVTDEGTRLVAAEYGAFLSSTLQTSDEAQRGHTFSADSYPAFDDLLNASNSGIYLPVFQGEGPVRLDDLAVDGRAGASALLQSNGHLPMRSLLAVPVVSGTGDVLGGLFFGHSSAGKFSQRDEEIAKRIATWASIALDNARLYAQAKVIEEELRQANFAKDEFLGLISHELRTPVTTIYGGLRILHTHRDLLEGDQANELIESMSDEGVRLVRLIEDLLALTRVELGKEIDRSPAIANDMVRECVTSYTKLRPDRPVNILLGDSLPLIEVEPTYFRQILTNLLSNADKYSPSGLPVVVGTTLNGNDVCVEVTDAGDGVAAGEEDKIFDTFFRSEKTAGKAPGQGLGLTVCRKLVEAQGGRIWARNNPDGGFSVGFSFPAMSMVEEDSVVG